MPSFSRRSFLQTAAAASMSPLRGATRPNIIVILADDLGYSDVGCYGSEIATPNLDALARGGLRLTHFYNTARCCPTRAALLTGLYNHQAGIGHMVANRGYPSYQGYLNDQCVTLGEAMGAGGYKTAMSGKWHVGEERPHWPTDRGFQRYFGLISGATNYFKVDAGRTMAINDQPYVPPEKGFYITDAITDHAIGHMEAFGRGEDPFFMYVAYTAPHWPLHAHESDTERYLGRYMKGWDALRRERHARMVEMGIVDKNWPLTPRDTPAPAWDDVQNKKDFDRKMAVYAAQVECMDRNIGRIVAKVRELGQEENTLIMFLADNGGCAEEVDRGEKGAPAGVADSYLSYGLPWANASNTPFRLYKHWVHEGGIATPFIARWPSVIKQADSITTQPGHLIDVMATCLDAGGVRYPGTYRGRKITPLEGKSLLPVFQGKRREGHDALYWEHEGNRAVREGKWKLVSRYPGDWELYDLEADRTELHNLAAVQQDRVKRMSRKYDAWAKRAGVIPWQQLQKPGNG